MTFARKRRATDARTILEAITYSVKPSCFVRGKPTFFDISRLGERICSIQIVGGCVDEAEVEKLLSVAKQ